MDGQSQKTNFIEEIRKTHPKAYARWTAEEDKTLLDVYNIHKTEGGGGFEAFLERASAQFGRRPNGIRGRLAKYFTDIVGWDYQAQKKRDEERKSRKADPSVTPSPQEGMAGERLQKHDDLPQFSFSNNPQAQTALGIMQNTRENLFLTGEAGTGKSTLLQNFRKTTEKNVVVLAPTGVAALNVQGQTIHSFCAFGPDITLQKVKKLNPSSGKHKLLQQLSTIVIDEISMVRADLLDCVDKFLRINGPAGDMPFGGLQMIFIGDLYQLPPVDKDFGSGGALIKEYASPYFFDSRAFKSAKFNFVELKTMYRQKEQVFLQVLNAVRNNAASAEHLSVLNSRVHDQDDHFTPPHFSSNYNSSTQGLEGQKNKMVNNTTKNGAGFTFEKFSIYLTPINRRAAEVNNYFLQRIESPVKIYTGSARGSFQDRELPTDLNLQIKVGAQIMMLNNDQRKRWVNGTMGKIIGIKKSEDVSESLVPSPQAWGDVSSASERQRGRDGDTYEKWGDFEADDVQQESSDAIIVELETGETVEVEPYTWEMFQFILDKYTQSVDSKTVGTYTQYPFKLAWAVTIHKAQGKTFDKVYVDLSTGTFAHGQLYVALSRCRTLAGLTLKRPICPQDIILDQRIVKFLERFATGV
jgi:ATP-dependent exoDNAse (exonuclease V) alpha subunit